MPAQPSAPDISICHVTPPAAGHASADLAPAVTECLRSRHRLAVTFSGLTTQTSSAGGPVRTSITRWMLTTCAIIYASASYRIPQPRLGIPSYAQMPPASSRPASCLISPPVSPCISQRLAASLASSRPVLPRLSPHPALPHDASPCFIPSRRVSSSVQPRLVPRPAASDCVSFRANTNVLRLRRLVTDRDGEHTSLSAAGEALVVVGAVAGAGAAAAAAVVVAGAGNAAVRCSVGWDRRRESEDSPDRPVTPGRRP